MPYSKEEKVTDETEPIYRNIAQFYLRDLSLEIQNVPYDQRQDYINKEYRYNELIHRMIKSQKGEQILINLDESELFEGEVPEEKTKAWSHLYSPDLELLFNPKVFPMEVLKGDKVGDYYIVKYGLFDDTLQPHMVELTARSSQANSIGFEVGPAAHKNSISDIIATERLQS